MKRLFAVALLACLAGCARPEVVRSALHGDLGTLKREIAKAREGKDLHEATVVALAGAVAAREVRSATGVTAVRRLEQVRPCAGHLLDVVRDRARRRDDAGATATIILLEAGAILPADLVSEFRDARSGAWRAVAARAMLTPADALARRTAMADPDERVRRAALAAAVASPAPDDLESLLEASRVDPDPEARRIAIRAVGGIGGERAVLALADRWATADEDTRRALIEAWAEPSSYVAGGRARIQRVIETSSGIPAIVAAGALVGRTEGEAELGATTLASAIAIGSAAERRLAMNLAPTSCPEVKMALAEAAKDPERAVRVLALAHLVDRRQDPGKAMAALRELAAGEAGDPITLQARSALAAAGDESVSSALRTELSAPRSFRRRLAAQGLVALGNHAHAATALGDDDPYVRTAVACAILADGDTP
ncbi:MAG: HEAT repeat domain-containing protein [Polyangiaceae bacterium]|nr:HEAT repeat domain-containing protein [Polyangiaceae bacterium]